MRKAIIFAVFTLLTAGTAYATFSAGNWGTDLPPGLSGKLSTNVQLYYKNDSATPKPTGYVAATYHIQGTKTFASSSGDAAIFVQDATAVSNVPGAPSGTASAGFGGSWSAL